MREFFMDKKIYHIHNLTYDPILRRLSSDDGKHAFLTPKEGCVLTLLLEAKDHCINKEVLFCGCWGDTIVTEQSLTNIISKLRKILKSVCGNLITISTVIKEGYILEILPETKIEDVSDEVIVTEQCVEPATQIISTDKKRYIIFSMIFAALLIMISIYTYYARKSPYYLDKQQYNITKKINKSRFYLQSMTKKRNASDPLFDALSATIPSDCNLDLFVRIYQSIDAPEKEGMSIFLVNDDNQYANFYLSDYKDEEKFVSLKTYLTEGHGLCI
ncbi:hypothetical protein CTN03_05590 [Photobacterium angustum]|nr:hypothetical protein CTN03_05590 [Photobacterium angustum]